MDIRKSSELWMSIDIYGYGWFSLGLNDPQQYPPTTTVTEQKTVTDRRPPSIMDSSTRRSDNT